MNTETYRAMVGAIEQAGGAAFQIGGSVRDRVMGIPSDDVDTEVFGLTYDQIIDILSAFGHAQFMGAAFGIVSVTVEGVKYDFTIPRLDNRAGKGRAGFRTEFDPHITIAQAAARRDFTMNAMAIGSDGQIHDPFNGQADIQAGVIRHTSAAFAEDPLRVMRGMRFASRFNMRLARETVRMAASVRSGFSAIAPERMWAEWAKWAMQSVRPSRGMTVMYQTGWVWEFPELADIIGVPQNPAWHPEGSVWEHTRQVVDAAASICDRDGIDGDDRMVIVFGALCHDMGKAVTTVRNERGEWVSPGHAELGAPIAERWMQSIGAPERIVRQVVEMVRFHMRHVNHSARGARRVAAEMTAPFHCLAAVIEADHSGRRPMPAGMPVTGAAFIDALHSARQQVAQPFVMGRHMIERGVSPGPHMGVALRAAYEAQIDGHVTCFEDAVAYAMARL